MNHIKKKDKQKLQNDVFQFAEENSLDIFNQKKNYKTGSIDLDEAFYVLTKNGYLKDLLFDRLIICLNNVKSDSAQKKGLSVPAQKLNELQDVFKFSQIEKELLKLYYLTNTNTKISAIQADLGRHINESGRFSITVISVLCACNRMDVRNILFNKNSTLIRTGLIDRGDRDVLSDEIILFIDGKKNKAISEYYFCEFTGNAVSFESHIIKNEEALIIRNLIKTRKKRQALNLLFYGKAGAGKTEFARSLAKTLNYKLYEINNPTDKMNSENGAAFRFKAFIACQQLVKGHRAIILMDEADALLNSERSFFSSAPVTDKSKINMKLDQSATINIWITNRFDGIDESTKRRFDYSLHFGKLTNTQRKLIWKNRIEHYNLSLCFSDSLLERLSSEYEVSSGGIDIVLRNIQQLNLKNKPELLLLNTAERILNSHLKLISGRKNIKTEYKENAPNYDINGLNINGNLNHVIEAIKGFNNYWLNMDERSEVKNMNMLLYGPPGTGKTEFARYVSRLLKRKLLLKKASDLFNPYVGMTEIHNLGNRAGFP